MHRPIRTALAALLALALAACGDDGGAATTAAPTTTTSGATTTDAATTTAPDADTTTSTTAGGSTPAANDVASLLERFRATPLRTTYAVGGNDTPTVMILSQDPTQDPPVSTIIVAGPPPGDTEEARILTVGETVVFCGPPGEGCFESPLAGGAGIAEGILGPLVSAFLITSAPEGNPGFELDTSSVEIAGRTGVCFTFAPETIVGSDTEYVRQCVDAELGFTLLTEVRESGATEADRVMELLEYGPPLPEDFSPTGPVTELPES